MKSQPIPVLIAGAGPVGLAMAIELGSRGIRCLVAERNDRVGYAPRAKTTNVRTREHFRRWGIAEKLASASPLGVDYPANVTFVTRLGGHFLHKIENALFCAPQKSEFYSEHSQWIPQYKTEDVLRAHAETLPGVEIRFDCEFQSCVQNEHGIESVLKDLRTGETYSVGSDYLVGADGARSVVRDVIGAKLEGTYGLSRNYNIVFRAPGLAEAHHHEPAIMYWQVNTDCPSLIGPMDTGDRWFFMPTGIPDGVKLSDAEAAALIRTATGIDLPYEVLSTDEWVASRFIADKYRDRRIFLAGDACHLHPPFGGYGMNMGVSDAVDLGWKLAAVLQGWGGEGLLDSYERERRPVHQQVIDEAVQNHAVLGNQLWRDGLEDDTPAGRTVREQIGEIIGRAKRREFLSLGIVIGYRYERSPVIAYDQSAPTGELSPDYTPSSAPGCIAPHAWLADGRSLYDTFGAGFTLLVLGDVASDTLAAAAADAAGRAIPLKIVVLTNLHLLELYEAPLALIRPDQHVAWRGESWPGGMVLDLVSGRAGASPLNRDCALLAGCE